MLLSVQATLINWFIQLGLPLISIDIVDMSIVSTVGMYIVSIVNMSIVPIIVSQCLSIFSRKGTAPVSHEKVPPHRSSPSF